MRQFPHALAIGGAILAAAVPFAVASVDAKGDLPVTAGSKTDRLPAAACSEQDWPYVSGSCLPGATPARVIAITGENSTVLVR